MKAKNHFKGIVLLFIFLSIAFSDCKKNDTPSNSESSSKCYIQYLGNTQYGINFTYTYGANNRLEEISGEESGDITIVKLEYNQNGKIDKISYFDEDNQLDAYQEFSYHTDGNLISGMQYDADGNVDVTMSYLYNDNNEISIIQLNYSKSGIEKHSGSLSYNTIWSFKNFSANKDIAYAPSIVLSFHNSNIVSETWYDGEIGGSVIRSYEYNYDDKNNPFLTFNLPVPLTGFGSYGSLFSKNNPTQISSYSSYNGETEVSSVSYDYNSYGYPIVFDFDNGSEIYSANYNCENCSPLPTKANAGPDQIDISGSSTNLEANSPNFGTGLWGIVSGSGGNIYDVNNPNTEFAGIAGIDYQLSWKIFNDCGESVDYVTIKFYSSAISGEPCPNIPTVEYGGEIYHTVQIGDQCWMQENLKIGDTLLITEVPTDNGIIEKYHAGDEAGGLYTWGEMMNYSDVESSQGICPTGWHIPSDNEWKRLEGFVDTQYDINDPIWDDFGYRGLDVGLRLKSTSIGGQDTYNFKVVYTGMRVDEFGGWIVNGNVSSHIWTSSQLNGNLPIKRRFFQGENGIDKSSVMNDYAMAVRCMKNI